MTGRFNDRARRAIDYAVQCARSFGHSYVGSEHLLMGILQVTESTASMLLRERGVTEQKLRDDIAELSGVSEPSEAAVGDMTPRCRKLVRRAAQEAESTGNAAGTEHLLMVLLEEECVASRLLARSRVRRSELYILLDSAVTKGRYDMQTAKLRCEDRTVMLDKHGRDLTLLAAQGRLDPVIGREREEERVMRILLRRTKNNPLLIGEPGVGKTAIAERIAMRIASGDVPERLAGKRVVALDMSVLVAGTKYRGEFEEKMKTIINEIRQDGEIILFIDEVHTLVGAGAAEGAVDASNILKPALARGELQLIGATTLDEYRKTIERDGALARRFQCVNVREPTTEGCIEILEGLRARYEAHHGVTFTKEALEAAVELSVRYMPERRLPDKAIDLLDEAAARCSLLPDGMSVTAEDIAETAELVTGIPVVTTREESDRLLDLERELSEEIVGQNEAIAAISDAIRRSRAGIGDETRPIGSFLFCGAPGVGKTETAKVLSKVLFGKDSLIRLDMSEYTDRMSVTRLIGSPPGYAGYGEGGVLTEFVRRRPYCVVLFDEIEKAAPEVISLLLQILDEASLTDACGHTVSFADTVVILTSNLTPHARGVGFTSEPGGGVGTLAPELINRIDETVRFKPLTEPALELIARRQLEALRGKLVKRGIDFEYSDELCCSLVGDCQSSRGARDLRAVIRRRVEKPIANRILSQGVRDGDKVTLSSE